MVAAAFPVAWWALAGDRASKQMTSQNLAGMAPTMRQVVLQRSPLERVALPAMRHIGARIVRFTPIGWVEGKTRALARAGLSGRVTAEQILGFKLVVPLVFTGLAGLRLVGGAEWGSTAILAVLAFAGFFAPDLLVRAAGDRRSETITSVLPDLLDQVTIAIEAGLGLEAALARSCQGRTSPLAQEIVRTLQDIRLGSTRSEALDALARRTQVDDLRSVVLALRQATSLGVPLADTLRMSAGDMREKRRFRAEERAQRLPTLMIFPLGLCILPALFIVILGPAVVSSGAP
jgi:tight adherence protein C